MGSISDIFIPIWAWLIVARADRAVVRASGRFSLNVEI
jgi:hypothetical protein